MAVKLYKSDFDRLAKILHHYSEAARSNESVTLIGDLIDDLGDFLAECNPRFDKDYFVKGCEEGVE